MTPHLIKFELDHIRQIAPREIVSEERIRGGIENLQRHEYLAFTAVLGEKIIGCAGICVGVAYGEQGEEIKDPRAGYVWVNFAEDIERHKFWFHRNVKRYLRACVRTYRLAWVMAAVAETSMRNCKWIERLGFRAIGKLTYQGESHYRYVLEIK